MKTKRTQRKKQTHLATAIYKTILRSLLLENEVIAPERLRKILKPYVRLLS